ncbi:MAG TPA: hypothetical protein VJJ51_05185 [Candidatus Methanoperedens sp.]|nr:hypothetical protein [Candidatus Methanoperedens sp.]
MRERLKFEREIRDLGLDSTQRRAEIGGFWVTLDSLDIVRIILIDPTGVFKNKDELRKKFMSELENKFNNLDPNWLKKQYFVFKVEYMPNQPADKEKAGFKKLDFPVYLLDKQHGYKTILKLMKQHKIPKIIYGTDIYDLAENGWKNEANRGVGIPSGKGYRKVAFIKTHRVFEDATGDLWQAFVNVTAHEIGHMGNRYKHSKKGLMKYPVPLNKNIDFSTDDKYLFLTNLVRLRNL